jgi:hypothetical protein
MMNDGENGYYNRGTDPEILKKKTSVELEMFFD